MKKEVNQNEGINQVALINSKGNQVTIINSPAEYMSWLIRNGKIDEAVEELAKMHKKTEELHPLYPLYYYKPVQIGSKIVFKHIPANKKIAEDLPLQFKGNLTVKDRDFKKGETVGDYLIRKYFSQEKISIDVKYIETWIGGQVIKDPHSFEQHAVKDGEWFIVPRDLPSPIKAKLILTEQIDRVIIDYLELRVTKIDSKENRIIISNISQESSPVILSLTIPNLFMNNYSTETNQSKFNITIRENFEGQVKAEKMFLEFMKYIEESSKMSLIDIENQKIFFTAESFNIDNPQQFQDMNDRILLLSDLIQIEDTMDVQFKLPENMVEEDFEKIEILMAIIEEKEIISSVESFSATFDNKEALKKLIFELKESPIMITSKEDMTIELFGVKFENIKIEYKFENLIVKNLDRLKKKLEYLDVGETVIVEFRAEKKDSLLTRYTIGA